MPVSRFLVCLGLLLWASGNVPASYASDKNKSVLEQVLAVHVDRRANCDEHLLKRRSGEIFQSGPSTWIVLIQCNLHVYQSSWLAYRATGKASDLEIARLSFARTQDGRRFTATEWLTSPEWKSKTKELSTFHKGRGMGDCGTADTYRWNGHAFYLVIARFQPCCWTPKDFETRPACKKLKDDYPIPEENWPVVYEFRE